MNNVIGCKGLLIEQENKKTHRTKQEMSSSKRKHSSAKPLSSWTQNPTILASSNHGT
jgi:hypothetical protein